MRNPWEEHCTQSHQKNLLLVSLQKIIARVIYPLNVLKLALLSTYSKIPRQIPGPFHECIGLPVDPGALQGEPLDLSLLKFIRRYTI